MYCDGRRHGNPPVPVPMPHHRAGGHISGQTCNSTRKDASYVVSARSGAPSLTASSPLAIGIIPSVFTRAILPHSDPGKEDRNPAVYTRDAGPNRLSIYSGATGTHLRGIAPGGIPYGATCRYLIAYICGLARRQNSPIVNLGPSQSRAFKALSFDNTGGPNGRIPYIQDQLCRLSTAAFRFEHFAADTSSPYLILNAPLVRRAAFWFAADASHPVVPASCIIELDPWFYAHISQHGIPVDLPTFRQLARSSLACDLYAWLSRRIHALHNCTARKLTLSWYQVHQQFGPGYARTADFRKRALRQLARIQSYWPSLRYDTPRGRLTIHQGPLHVARTLHQH